MHSIDSDSDPTWRATSSSGGTQPRRFVVVAVARLSSLVVSYRMQAVVILLINIILYLSD